VLVLVGTLLSIAWMSVSSRVAGTSMSVVLGGAALILPAFLVAWLALGVSRRDDLDRRDLTGWVFVGLSTGAASVFALTVVLPDDSAAFATTPAIGAAAHILTLVFGAVGVLHWVRRLSPSATAGTALDLACVAVLAYVVSWRALLGGSMLAAGSGRLDSITMFATPALGTLVLVAVVSVLSQIGREQLRGAELLATFGLGGMVATDLALAVRGVSAGGHDNAWHDVVVTGGSSPVITFGWVLGIAAIGFGASIRRARPQLVSHVPLLERSTTWELLISLVPFTLLGGVLLAAAVRGDGMFTAGTIGALGALLLLRCALISVTAIRAARTSDTDHLTSALSHRQFQERVPIEVERAVSNDRPISLLVFDVDDFGLLNDSYSHAEGDTFLQELAWTIRGLLTPGQLLFRNGGDEFALLLPDLSWEAACELGERIARSAHEIRPNASISPTLTMGVASIPEHASDAHELVQLANGTLYWGKLSGKASVLCYDAEVVKALDADERLAVMERNARLRAVFALARALDARDAYTARHSENVARYSLSIASELGWAPERLDLLRIAGQLHDIGKIGVRDSTLRKSERLTEQEWEEMGQHPVLGARMVSGVAPEEIVPWIMSHHERVDGTGYPHRLCGAQIPDGARVLAVADAFDAMTSSRSYRRAMSPLRAIDVIVSGAGEQFDPAVVRAFLAALKSGAIDVASVMRAAATTPAQEQHAAAGELEAVTVDPEFLTAAEAVDPHAVEELADVVRLAA